MKIHPMVAEFLHSDRRTDGRTDMTKSLLEILRTRLKMTAESITTFSMGCTAEYLGFDSLRTYMWAGDRIPVGARISASVRSGPGAPPSPLYNGYRIFPGNKAGRGVALTTHPHLAKGKGKSVPLQAWSGPEGSRKLRFPDFMKTAQDGGKVVSLTHRPPLPPGYTPGTYFC